MSRVCTLSRLRERELEASALCVSKVNEYINSLSNTEMTVDIVNRIIDDLNHPIHGDMLSIMNDRNVFAEFIGKLELSDRERSMLLSLSNGIAGMACDDRLKDYTISKQSSYICELEAENGSLKEELSSRAKLSDKEIEGILSSRSKFHKRKMLSKVDVYKRFGLSY